MDDCEGIVLLEWEELEKRKKCTRRGVGACAARFAKKVTFNLTTSIERAHSTKCYGKQAQDCLELPWCWDGHCSSMAYTAVTLEAFDTVGDSLP